LLKYLSLITELKPAKEAKIDKNGLMNFRKEKSKSFLQTFLPLPRYKLLYEYQLFTYIANCMAQGVLIEIRF